MSRATRPRLGATGDTSYEVRSLVPEVRGSPVATSAAPRFSSDARHVAADAQQAEPCPVCGGPGRRDRPDLFMLDCVCTKCGWHFTSCAARLALAPDPLASSLRGAVRVLLAFRRRGDGER